MGLSFSAGGEHLNSKYSLQIREKVFDQLHDKLISKSTCSYLSYRSERVGSVNGAQIPISETNGDAENPRKVADDHR